MKQLIDHNKWNGYNITVMVFVGISLILQALVSVALVLLAKEGEFVDEKKRDQLVRSNNYLTLLVLATSTVNIFINALTSNNFSKCALTLRIFDTT